MGFVPVIEKVFKYKEGDLLAEKKQDEVWITKIIKVVKLELKSGNSYTISGKKFAAPSDDFTLGTAIAISQFEGTIEEAKDLASQNLLVPKLGSRVYSVMRASGLFAEHQTHIGSEPVKPEELDIAYHPWKKAWDAGNANLA